MASLLTHTWTIALRNRLRGNRVARLIYKRWMGSHDYEESFGKRLLASVDGSSIVWDVGANIGLYTSQFLAKGARNVVCWEPAPEAARALRERFGAETVHSTRVIVMQAALSNASGIARFSAHGDSVTNRLASVDMPDTDSVEVDVLRADEAVAAGRVPGPTVVKIDVEGFELDVLQGFGAVLESVDLRAVFVEVHFTRLHERNMDKAPREIDSMLSRAGFKTEWLDLSHVCGIRR